MQAGERHGVVVLVPHGDDGELETSEPGDVIGVRARRVDDDAAADLAAVRLHRGDTTLPAADRLDRRPRLKAHAHAPALALVRLRHSRGAHVPVGRTPEHRLDGAEIDRRPEPLRLGAVDQGDLQAGLLADGLQPPQLLDTRGGERDADRADLVPVRASLGVVPLQLAERVDRVHGEPHALHARSHLPAEPGALRGGDLADVPLALDQQDVALPRARQAIGDAAADGAAPDDDDLALGEQAHASPPRSPPVKCFRCRCTKTIDRTFIVRGQSRGQHSWRTLPAEGGGSGHMQRAAITDGDGRSGGREPGDQRAESAPPDTFLLTASECAPQLQAGQPLAERMELVGRLVHASSTEPSIHIQPQQPCLQLGEGL